MDPVRIMYVGCDKAIIDIRQSKYGDAEVKYGKGDATDKTVSSDSSGVMHRITLNGLEEGTAYSFYVIVKDKFGRQSTLKNINEERQKVNFTFTTAQNCPTNADIQNVKVCRVTHDSAEIFCTLLTVSLTAKWFLANRFLLLLYRMAIFLGIR